MKLEQILKEALSPYFRDDELSERDNVSVLMKPTQFLELAGSMEEFGHKESYDSLVNDLYDYGEDIEIENSPSLYVRVPESWFEGESIEEDYRYVGTVYDLNKKFGIYTFEDADEYEEQLIDAEDLDKFEDFREFFDFKEKMAKKLGLDSIILLYDTRRDVYIAMDLDFDFDFSEEELIGKRFHIIEHIERTVKPKQEYLKVKGHEGRHRMAALRDIENNPPVDVRIILYRGGKRLTKNKIDVELLDEIFLKFKEVVINEDGKLVYNNFVRVIG